MTDIEDIVREMYLAMNDWDVDSYMNHFSDDATIMSVSNRVYDTHGLRDMISSVKNAFPNRKLTIERIMTKDNAAMVEFTWAGTHTGEYLGNPATNNRIEFPNVDILEFESGKVKYYRMVFNWTFIERGINP